MCRLRNITLESVTEKCDRQTDEGQSDPYVSLCFAGDTKMQNKIENYLKEIKEENKNITGVKIYL